MNEKPSIEESFRESLKDVQVVIERLAGHCADIPELLESVKLAIENHNHLKLMMSFVTSKKK